MVLHRKPLYKAATHRQRPAIRSKRNVINLGALKKRGKKKGRKKGGKKKSPPTGFEPATFRLTAERAAGYAKKEIVKKNIRVLEPSFNCLEIF